MAFLQSVMCPMNLKGSGDNEQICFSNYNEVFGLPRGTIFGINRASLNRWKYAGDESKGEMYLEPPFDFSNMTNHQLVLERTPGGMTNPNNADAWSRQMGTMKCAPGTVPVWRGSAFMRTQSGKMQPVSIWQCTIPNSPTDKVRTQGMTYA